MLKLIVEMRNDSSNTKYQNWSVKYLFGHHLFGSSFAIMTSVELIFSALYEICHSLLPEEQADQKQKLHREKVLTLLSSVIDFYDVIFRNIKAHMAKHMNATKKFTPEAKRNFLRSLNLERFFLESGQQTIAFVSGKKRTSNTNLKFIKILLDRSEEFESFIKFVYSKKDGETMMDEPIFQLIRILSNLIEEAEARRQRQEEDEKKQQERAEQQQLDTLHLGERSESENSSENASRKVSDNFDRPQLSATTSARSTAKQGHRNKRVFGFDGKHKRDTDGAILFEDDDEEDAAEQFPKYRGNHNLPTDDKTKNYLESIKAYRDEDEYDDTHETGDRRIAQQRRARQRNFTRNREEEEEEEDEDEFVDPRTIRAANNQKKPRRPEIEVEEEEEDESDEEFDPMDLGEKKLSKTSSHLDSQADDRPANSYNKRGGSGIGTGKRGSQGQRRGDGNKDRYKNQSYRDNDRTKTDFNRNSEPFYPKNSTASRTDRRDHDDDEYQRKDRDAGQTSNAPSTKYSERGNDSRQGRNDARNEGRYDGRNDGRTDANWKKKDTNQRDSR